MRLEKVLGIVYFYWEISWLFLHGENKKKTISIRTCKGGAHGLHKKHAVYLTPP